MSNCVRNNLLNKQSDMIEKVMKRDTWTHIGQNSLHIWRGSTFKLKLKEWLSYEQRRIKFVGRSVPGRWKRLSCVRENKRKTR